MRNRLISFRCITELSIWHLELAITRNSDREIEKDRDKEKNAHGETRLHIAARSSDTAMLEKLIAAVCSCAHSCKLS